MAGILIKNGKVWDGERFLFSDVLIDKCCIASVSPDINADVQYIYDASDKIVSPGLVDIHTHMLGYFGINADMSCIPFGVTAAADACAVQGCREQYDNYLVKNKLFISAEFENNTAKYENLKNMLEYS